MAWAYTVPRVRAREGSAPTLDDVFRNPRRFGYIERDLFIFRDLLLRRYMRTDQVDREHFQGAQRAAQQRMKLLYERWYVNRCRPPAQRGQGSFDYIYWLDWLGWRALRYEDDVWTKAKAGQALIVPGRSPRLPSDAAWTPLNLERRWRPPDRPPVLHTLFHDVELGDLCMNLRDDLRAAGYGVRWRTTREAEQSLKEHKHGGPSYDPDGIFEVTKDGTTVVLHLEYERSGRTADFRQKVKLWDRYREAGLWRKAGYPHMPFVVIVGNRVDRPEHGQHSIERLRAEAARRHLRNVGFCYLDDGYWDRPADAFRSGGAIPPWHWTVHTPAGEKGFIANPSGSKQQANLFDQVEASLLGR